MKIMKITIAAAIVLLIGLAGNVRSQEPYRMSEREMKDLLGRIDKQSEVFRGSLKRAMNHSRLDDTKAEDRINDFVKGFTEATERLKHRYSDKRTASADVEEVLNRAARIDDFMTWHQLSPRAESDWLRCGRTSFAEATVLPGAGLIAPGLSLRRAC